MKENNHGFNMKFIRNFFDYIINIFSKIPVYLRALVIFFIIVFISIAFNKFNTPDYFIDNRPGYIILNKPLVENSNEYTKQDNKNDLNEKVEVDKENNYVKGTVKENLKSSTPKINTPNRIKNEQKREENLNNSHLTSFINDYVIGDEKAPVSIVEYSSFKCPYCIKFHKENMEKVKTNYIDAGKVKYVKRVIIQKDTLLGVMLPYCARPEVKYVVMNDLFDNADTWTKSSTQSKELKEIAIRNGFTPVSYSACIKDENLANKLLNKQNAELKDLNIYSTPTVFINGERQKGNMSYEELSKKIDQAFLESKDNN